MNAVALYPDQNAAKHPKCKAIKGIERAKRAHVSQSNRPCGARVVGGGLVREEVVMNASFDPTTNQAQGRRAIVFPIVLALVSGND